MTINYELDAEDNEIINELDNLFGVVQNKKILEDMIIYTKLKQNNEITFGNYNIIIRNNSSYNLLNDLLKVCGKIFLKYNIIKNPAICYLDKLMNSRKDNVFDKIHGIEEDIIVINNRKLRFDYSDEIDNLSKIMKQLNNKIFIFEDTNFCEGEIDAELGELASWRMTIEKISLDDKLIYCENKLDENNLTYRKQELKDFANVQFWVLKNMVTNLIIKCKNTNITSIDKTILDSVKETYSKKEVKRNVDRKVKKVEKSAKEELNDLIGLDSIKLQINKVLNYIKLNKKRGEIPTLHMCFTGNPGTGKTSIARVIGKIFEEENILNGNGHFVEVHGRDLVAKYVGWTAQKVHQTVEEAIGGVLFIDEAYSLVSDRKGGFEDEAIATLIKEMEDHRNEVCIILAGYTNEMEDLIQRNPGFASRIQFTINFPDYSAEELFEIFTELCKKEHYKLSEKCKGILIENFELAKNKEAFGNGRYVRNIFEKIKFEQANRIVQTNSKSINSINKCDVENVLKTTDIVKEETRKIGFSY